MKYLKKLQFKILQFELRLRYVIKSLSLFSKVLILGLLTISILSGLIALREVDKNLSIETPDHGGTLREGIIGTPRFVNPVLTISDADRDLTKIIYSGLLRTNGNSFELDLAEKYEIDEENLCYTFVLKPDLLWSDGESLTVDDVIFTIDQIKNPLTKSSKRASWEGVNVEKIDEKTVRFCLEKPYSPFLENTTIGIIPKHIWQDILPEQMPLSIFNIEAIGSGPYKINKISRNSSGIIVSYELTRNSNFALQKPFLNKIIFKFYPSEKKLIEDYEAGKIDSLSAISPKNIEEIQKAEMNLKTYLLPRIFAVFFNQNDAPVFTNKEVREALNLSVDKNAIIENILKNFGIVINNPIPPGSIGALNEKDQDEESYESRLEQARKLLEKNGWVMNEEENVLEYKTKKETTRLEFSLSTSNLEDLVQTANLLKEMWAKIGAKVDVKIYEIGDLEQNVIRPRKYGALLFGEVTGRDPDPFAFWHSSQRNDPGLNIALYTNITVDSLLEKARETFDTKQREEKYREFQEEVQEDAPAVFLYSPYFIHILPSYIKGLDEDSITTPEDRFSQIYKWHTNTKRIWKILLPQ
ncbi:MAG: peptide ABC transporter substrate-binding protein [Candidatus Marinimicrobia bacterium]|nr:peptide ABC transporter substrate-binding protein [Candidatus Neomarinimicrobiota bacterium]